MRMAIEPEDTIVNNQFWLVRVRTFMILGRYSFFFANLFAVVLIINSAAKKNENPMIADKPEGLKPNLEAIA